MKIHPSKPHRLATFSCCLLLLSPLLAFAQEKKEEAKDPPKPAPKSIFPDKNLEKAVRQAVFAKRNTNEPITAEDVKNISTIKGQGLGIKDLTGLEHCQALASLELADNQIQDLKPIGQLKRVQLLDLKNNQIENLAPIAGMEALQYLNIEDNKVANVAPVAKLQRLNSFYGSGNRITDIRPLFSLPRLWSLNVSQNQIASLEGISALKRVDHFQLAGNKITDLTPLVEMWKSNENRHVFVRLYLAENPLSDPAKAQLKDLKALGLQIMDIDLE